MSSNPPVYYVFCLEEDEHDPSHRLVYVRASSRVFDSRDNANAWAKTHIATSREAIIASGPLVR